MSRSSQVLALVPMLSLVACGAKEPPATPPPSLSDPANAANAPVAVSSASAAPSEAATAPSARKRRPLEIYSHCQDVVAVVFAEDPKSPSAGRRTIAPSSAIDGPRDNDGNQTVWLLDEKNEPLVKVQVTRGMKRVEIGKSCRTLDAR